MDVHGCGFYRYDARIDEGFRSDGKLIAPTNKKFHIEFCTVAHWKNGEIIEEKLFYDLVGLLKQIGVMSAFLVRQLQDSPVLAFNTEPQSTAEQAG
jgi:SnoaL-like polyketide cyclase